MPTTGVKKREQNRSPQKPIFLFEPSIAISMHSNM